jgi:hypothetical protein
MTHETKIWMPQHLYLPIWARVDMTFFLVEGKSQADEEDSYT